MIYTLDAESYLEVYLQADSAAPNGSYRFTNCQLEIGSKSTEFEYRPIAEEKMLCEYYTRLASTNDKADEFKYFMRATPTVTGSQEPYIYSAEL